MARKLYCFPFYLSSSSCSGSAFSLKEAPMANQCKHPSDCCFLNLAYRYRPRIYCFPNRAYRYRPRICCFRNLAYRSRPRITYKQVRDGCSYSLISHPQFFIGSVYHYLLREPYFICSSHLVHLILHPEYFVACPLECYSVFLSIVYIHVLFQKQQRLGTVCAYIWPPHNLKV